jgi:hypothetical protein
VSLDHLFLLCLQLLLLWCWRLKRLEPRLHLLNLLDPLLHFREL